MTTVNDMSLVKFRKTGEIVKLSTTEGKFLSTLSPIPGWGGFGNNRGSDTILLDGCPIELFGARSNSIGQREFRFINEKPWYCK